MLCLFSPLSYELPARLACQYMKNFHYAFTLPYDADLVQSVISLVKGYAVIIDQTRDFNQPVKVFVAF